MKVRKAHRGDLEAVAAIAEAALPDTYQGLLEDATIERWLAATYSPAALLHRLEDHPIFVATSGLGEVQAFADAFIEDDRIVLSAIYVKPAQRDRGAGTALLRRVRALDARLPVSCDVILGNRKGEHFYEARGFVPGETVHVVLFGQPVIERRWWLVPAMVGSSTT